MVSLKFFVDNNSSGRPMALGLTEFLTEKSTRNISWGKGGWCIGLTTLPPSCADCLEIWEPQPPGTLRTSPGLYRDDFNFTLSGYAATVKCNPLNGVLKFLRVVLLHLMHL